jgi:protease YdgD
MYNKLFSLLTASTVIIAAAGVSVEAQSKPKIQPTDKPTNVPTFVKFDKAGKLNLSGAGDPFKPSNYKQSEKPYSGDRGIIGDDNRVPMLSREYPWSTIGRIQGTTTEAKSYHCTGTLIAEDLVLTNAHCVIDSETHQMSRKIAFLPNVINGKPASEEDIAFAEGVIYGTDFTADEITNQTEDWAIIKLNKPIGRKYGYLGWRNLPVSKMINNRKKFIFVGYSGDYPNPSKKGYEFLSAGAGWTASFQDGCSIVSEERYILYHDCDTTGGSSGGPIIGWINGKPYIVALNNAEIKNVRTNEGIINLAVKLSFLDRLAGKN